MKVVQPVVYVVGAAVSLYLGVGLGYGGDVAAFYVLSGVFLLAPVFAFVGRFKRARNQAFVAYIGVVTLGILGMSIQYEYFFHVR